MGKKEKGIRIGIILIIFGILFAIKKYFNFGFGSMIWFVLGLAFFVLYKNKGKKWALVPSGYFVYFWLSKILNGFGINIFLLTAGMFFIVPGIVFVILFFDNKKDIFRKCSCIFLSAGIFIILNKLLSISLLCLILFCAGFGFILSSVLKKLKNDRVD